MMNAQWDELCDDLGPAKILLLRESAAGLRAVVVVDSLAAGPAIGGVRMAPDLTVTEVLRLARAMTLRNAAAGLPYGGGKAGICADPAIGRADKERLVRWFTRAIGTLTDYIPGPDRAPTRPAWAGSTTRSAGRSACRWCWGDPAGCDRRDRPGAGRLRRGRSGGGLPPA